MVATLGIKPESWREDSFSRRISWLIFGRLHGKGQNSITPPSARSVNYFVMNLLGGSKEMEMNIIWIAAYPWKVVDSWETTFRR